MNFHVRRAFICPKNVTEYLADPPRPPPTTSQTQSTASPEPLPSGGLKLPPFAQRPQRDFAGARDFASARVGLNSLGYHRSVFTEDEARVVKETICSLMDEFEECVYSNCWRCTI